MQALYYIYYSEYGRQTESAAVCPGLPGLPRSGLPERKPANLEFRLSDTARYIKTTVDNKIKWALQ